LPRKKKAKKSEPTPDAKPSAETRPDETSDTAEAPVEDAPVDEAPSAEPTLEERLERAEREAAEQADRVLRTLAEFDNYRRRVQRDLDGASDRGAAEVLGELLEVVDNFDRALEHAGDDVPETFVEGMRLVARGLHEILERRGVARIEAVGEPFDPELHEALTAIPSEEAEPNTVLQEVQTGWRLGDRVLRAAKVVVSRAVEVEKDS
jgi:molecular chaperone GrpE